MRVRVYDGAQLCHTGNCCPVVEHDDTCGTVVIFDPAKPENGQFMMTAEEYNSLIANAKPVPVK